MNIGAFWLIASLIGLDFFGYGLALGFVAAIGVVVLVVLAGWLFYRFVVSRPRVQAVGAFVGRYFGEIYMEVA